ncbi:MAG: hypothetical protein AAGU27_15860 [Dehalobacterium sp.]
MLWAGGFRLKKEKIPIIEMMRRDQMQKEDIIKITLRFFNNSDDNIISEQVALSKNVVGCYFSGKRQRPFDLY